MTLPALHKSFAGHPHINTLSGKCSAPWGAGHPGLLSTARALIAPGKNSRLTPDGNPAELAFIWPNADHRLTIDPCPAAPAQTRINRCFEVLRNLPDTPAFSNLQQQTITRICQWHRQHDLRFGAWIGLRMRRQIVAGKLYLEVPELAPWQDWEAQILPPCPTQSRRNARPTMIGIDPQTGGIEIYYTVERLFTADIDALCKRLGCPPSASTITEFTSALTQRTSHFALPSYDMGFSNALDRKGQPSAFTWYSTTTGLMGPNGRTRTALVRTGKDRAWDMALYARLSTADALSGAARSVLIGTAISRSGPPSFTATLSMGIDGLARLQTCTKETPDG